MEQLQPQIDQFKTEKNEYLALKTQLDELIKEKEKTLNIIEALKNEIAQNAQDAKASLDMKDLSVDDYINIKQTDTGLKARIDYYSALYEEFDIKIYNKKEELYSKCNKLIKLRENIFHQKANFLIDEFISQNKDKLNEIFTSVYLSGVAIHNYSYKEKTNSEYVLDYINRIINKNINTNLNADKLFFFNYFINKSEIMTPAQRHKAMYDNKSKGFKNLLENL